MFENFSVFNSIISNDGEQVAFSTNFNDFEKPEFISRAEKLAKLDDLLNLLPH